MALFLLGNQQIIFTINNTVTSSHHGNIHFNQCSFSPSPSLSLSTRACTHTHAHIQNDKQSHLSGLMPTETFIKMKRRNRKETSGAIYFPVTVIKLLCHSLKTTQESLCSTTMQNAKASDFSRKKISFMILFPPSSKNTTYRISTKSQEASAAYAKQHMDSPQVEAKVWASVCAPRSPGFITHLQSLFVSLAWLCLPCWVPTT